MRFIIEDGYAADPNQPLAPPHPDLVALGTFKMRREDAAGYVYVSGFMRNVGNVSIRRPFKVALGVSIFQEPTSGSDDIVYSAERIEEVDQPVGMGEEVETTPMRVPLKYRDEGNARYVIEMIVDVNNDITELKARNNRNMIDWYFYRNTAKLGTDNVRIDKLAPSQQ